MDVFISYSTKDKNAADGIIKLFEENNISYWICKSEIIAGDKWAAEIVDALSKCKVFLLILSKNSMASEQVPKEINLAAGKRIPIIPYKIDNADMKGELSYHLANIHYIQATPSDNKYGELLSVISSRTGNPLTAPIIQNASKITNHITNNFPAKKSSGINPAWVVAALAVVALIGVLLARPFETADSEKKETQAVISENIKADESSEVEASEQVETVEKEETKSGNYAYAPTDIEPYQTCDNQNFYGIYKGGTESFCMSGETYTEGLTANGNDTVFFLFNVSDKGYTRLSFKSGHIDGKDNIRQYVFVHADGEEIFRKAVEPGALAEYSEIDITGAKQIKFTFAAPDAQFTTDTGIGLTDILFSDDEFVPEENTTVEIKSHEFSPKDLMPYQVGDNVNGYRIYNDSLKADDYFVMAGEKYTSGFTANGKLGAFFIFNLSDKGYTNMCFKYGHVDDTDNIEQYLTIYGDGEEICRKTVDPEALPTVIDIDIKGIKNIKMVFSYDAPSVITSADIGITDLVFYNNAEYEAK